MRSFLIASFGLIMLWPSSAHGSALRIERIAALPEPSEHVTSTFLLHTAQDNVFEVRVLEGGWVRAPRRDIDFELAWGRHLGAGEGRVKPLDDGDVLPLASAALRELPRGEWGGVETFDDEVAIELLPTATCPGELWLLSRDGTAAPRHVTIPSGYRFVAATPDHLALGVLGREAKHPLLVLRRHDLVLHVPKLYGGAIRGAGAAGIVAGSPLLIVVGMPVLAAVMECDGPSIEKSERRRRKRHARLTRKLWRQCLVGAVGCERPARLPSLPPSRAD
ncbi:MAG: hypothetical protein AAF533_02965 [Acidobacteriota bacterium]